MPGGVPASGEAGRQGGREERGREGAREGGSEGARERGSEEGEGGEGGMLSHRECWTCSGMEQVGAGMIVDAAGLSAGYELEYGDRLGVPQFKDANMYPWSIQSLGSFWCFVVE